MSDLEFQNGFVLDLVQAMLGLISTSMLGIPVEFQADQVVLHFAVFELTEEVEEDIDDIIGDVEALDGVKTDIVPEIFVGDPKQGWPDYVDGWPGLHHRKVFIAKPRQS